MMKKLFSALLILISINCFSQTPTTGYLRYDTVKVMKQNGNSNLIIENATRDSLGFLYNYGGGRTRFEVIRAVPGGIKVGGDTIIVDQSDLSDRLISGGQVIYSGSGLKFYVTPAVYVIDEVIYTTDYDSVTLSASDPADPRKDVIYLATTGVEVLTGTPAGPAAEPQLDGGQIKLTVVDIQNGATTPDLTQNIIWDENTESVVTNVGTTTDPDNLTNVYHLTKSINVSNIGNGDQIIITLPSTIDATAYDALVLFLKAKALIPTSTTSIRVTLFNGATQVSTEITLGHDGTSLDYRGISLPISRFQFNNTFFDVIRIRWVSGAGVHAGFYADYVYLVSGLPQPGGSGTPLTVGPIGAKSAVANGAIIENNVLYTPIGTQFFPGLISGPDKTKLDSLHSDYFIENAEGTYNQLATQINDSTVGIKTLKDSTGIGIVDNGTYLSIYNTGATTPTLQQVFDTEVGGSVLSKNDTISSNYELKIIGNSAVAFGNLFSVTNSSTTGRAINALSAGTNSTIQAINTKTTSGGGGAFLAHASGSNATATLTRDSTSTATVIKILELNRTTSGSAADGIGGALHFGVENSSANIFFANSVESIWKNSIDASKESMLRIRGVNNTVEEVYMDIQKGGIVIVNNGADTLAKLSDLTGGGSYTDADARAAISLTTTGTSGAATYNSGTGVFNIPDYSGGAAIWSGAVIGTSFSATGATINSGAVQWTFTGSSPATFTLPARTSSVNQFYTIKNIGSADLTVAAAGTDDIFTTSSVASVTVVPGGSVMITGAANGTSDLWTALFHTGAGSGGGFYINLLYLKGSPGSPVTDLDTLDFSDDFIDAFNEKLDTTTDNNLVIVGSTVNTNKAPLTLTDGATITWDATLGFNAKVTIAGNRTLDITNPQAGQYYKLTVRQDGTGTRTLALPSGSWFENGIDIVLTTTASAYDVLIAYYDGTNYFWKVAKDWKP